MKKVFLFCAVIFVALSQATALAQEGFTRAEFECMLLNTANGKSNSDGPARSWSYHHVWVPDLNYGFFQAHGVDMVYDIEGTGDETLVVVHGGPGLPHEYFHPLLSNLGRYMRVVYFDRRVDILSQHSSTEIISLAEMSDEIDALRKALGLTRISILGHSFGGSVALTYALRHPDQVKRLILVSTAATIENPADAEKRLVKALSADELSLYASTDAGGSPCDRVRRRYRALYPHYFHHTPNSQWLDLGVYSVYFDSMAKKLVLASRAGGFDVRSSLDKIKAPTLVLGGRHDLVTPLSEVRELAEGLPKSRLVVMEHSGHFPFIEENYLFTQWVRQFVAATADFAKDRITVQAPTGTEDRR
jgi:proline iminopeptidase